MEKVILNQLTESKTFTVDAKGKRFGFSKVSDFVNGKKLIIAQWKLNGEIVLEISSELLGTWRILKDGRKGYIFVPEQASENQWIVLLLQ